jgi:hypothetical protein
VSDDPVRVVIDSNVFVSAAIGRGASTRLNDQWMSGRAPDVLTVCPRPIVRFAANLTVRVCANALAPRKQASLVCRYAVGPYCKVFRTFLGPWYFDGGKP